MRIYPRVSMIPFDQLGALLVGVLATVGLWLLGNLAAAMLTSALLLLAGAGITIGAALMAWYWWSVIANLLWWRKCRRLDREEFENGRDY